MVRSLYSGVAGMVAHQTKMDVVGNNISNVSTYGYKSSRATFKDVYYQTNSAAMAATPSSGGTNPKQVGYGAKVGSVDVNHSQSVMSTTGYTLDVAIAGEGYLQVMDADGNIFYTKAGMLDIDAEGNLVDINGYFVLGVSGSPSGIDPSSNRIKVNLPYLQAANASVTDTINGLDYSIQAENQNENGNVNIQFVSSSNMPYGQKVAASITSASIVVTVNANERFENIEEFNKEMNLAITAANGGVKHNAGDFTLEMHGDLDNFPTGGLLGSEIVEPNFSVNEGTIGISKILGNYIGIKSVGDNFSGIGEGKFDIEFPDLVPPATAYDPSKDVIKFTYTDGNGVEYYNEVPVTEDGKLPKAGSVMLFNTQLNPVDSTDSFVITYPNISSFKEAYNTQKNQDATIDVPDPKDPTKTIQIDNPKYDEHWLDAVATPTQESKNLGIANGNFLLKGGTEGGEQTVADLTGISINQKGVIVAQHPVYGSLELGRIDLATFANPAGLSQVGDTYFAVSRNSGEPIISAPGTNGTGDILGGTLETSNTDLAHEMADMITTQRGFQACSRMITVSDSMLEELINLKR